MQLLNDFTAHMSPDHLGALLKWLRDRHGLAQALVVAHLPGTIDQQRYSSFELNKRSPTFDELSVIYEALRDAGVRLSLRDRNLFLDLARQQLETKRTHKVRKSPQEWDDLRGELAAIDRLPDAPSSLAQVSTTRGTPLPSRMEVSHLVGREDWLVSLYEVITGQPPIKWLILQGPPGIGKTSELHRIANYFQQRIPRYYVVLCQLPEREQEAIGADVALEVLLSDILESIGPANAPMPAANLQARMKYVLDCVARSDRPVLLLLDNAEHLLDGQGHLVPAWRQFYEKFVHARHHASLVLATKEWPIQITVEAQWARQSMVPALSQDEGIVLLQRLGLHDLSEEQLGHVVEVVGGIPVCLEWVTKLMREPLLQGDWSAFEEEEENAAVLLEKAKAGRLVHLLEDASLFSGPVATRVTPLLDRVMKRLSTEALTALRELALAPVPLAAPGLKVLYHDPAPLQELRDASLLAAYRKRVQLLPMVAALIRTRLSAQQKHDVEERLANALLHWLVVSRALGNREMGMIIAGLAEIYLRHHRLLDAAQFIVRYGWLAFNLGYARRLAELAMQALEQEREALEENRCGALLLRFFLGPYLGQKVDERQKVADYQHIRLAFLTDALPLHPSIEVAVVYTLMTSEMDMLQFEEAQALYDECFARLQAQAMSHPDLQGSLMEKQAWLWARWSEYAEELGDKEKALILEEQAVTYYRKMVPLLTPPERCTSLERISLQKRLARALNNLAYQLNRRGQYAEALEAIEQSIELKEQGRVEIDTLADAYGEKSQILAQLGRFQEALVYDEKAYDETLRLANAGFRFSEEELRMYQVNRGCLYLRLGRIEEAEQWLRRAFPLPPRRRTYAMVAEQALNEIKHWRQESATNNYQLDWRWIDRYRTLVSFDSYWWLAPAGPFTSEEQQVWDATFVPALDEATKVQLGEILYQARQRELEAALSEQREPQLSYPALAIEEVQEHITGLISLQAEIEREEPHPIVRRLYRDAIEEELDFLLLIKATYEGNTEHYRERSLRLIPIPTSEEMQYALDRVRFYLQQGLLQPDPEIAAASQRVAEMLSGLGIVFDFPSSPAELEELRQTVPLVVLGQRRKMISAQAARRFFATILHENGYAEWQVVIDQNATSARIEQGQRCIYLPNAPLSLEQIKADLSHELAGHVARCIAGEHSKLGLLGIHTKNSLETEEGLATYYDRQTAALQGAVHDETGIWFGTLATGLASGVLVPPQTFRLLVVFFEEFVYLYRLLRRPDQFATTARTWAHKIALERGIRTYRGVPDLAVPGVCYSKDALYLRGLQKIEQAVAQEGEGVLDRLAVGVVAWEQLLDLAELGIVQAPQPLRKLVQNPDITSYILSFDVQES
ncbi:MAG TPA: tetratricopeptide repeat protein [Ktedonobacteraceae bacterium]|nr:tetratricopeptide repeat protein [Ktedonobacteraceae bacterium]